VRRGDGVELTIGDPLALAASVRTSGAHTRLSAPHITLSDVRGEIELIDTYGDTLLSTPIEAVAAAPLQGRQPPPGVAGPRDAAWFDRWPAWGDHRRRLRHAQRRRVVDRRRC
jgi:hypothetical protein